MKMAQAGIPQDIRLAHKYGRELHVDNDAGVVFAPGHTCGYYG
jgi:SpoU rRNA methylase family enzyme